MSVHIEATDPVDSRVIRLSGRPTDSARVQSVMLFPNDKDTRREYLSELDIQNIERMAREEPNSPVTMLGSQLCIALRRNARSRIRQLAYDAYQRGVVAGKVVAYIHALAKADAVKYVGVNGAIATIKQEELEARSADAQRRRVLASKAPVSKRRPTQAFGDTQLKAAWDEYRAVAHLWAAHLHRPNRRGPRQMLSARQEDMESFCNIAREYLEFGEAFKFERVKKADVARLLLLDESFTIQTRAGARTPVSSRIVVSSEEVARVRGLFARGTGKGHSSV